MAQLRSQAPWSWGGASWFDPRPPPRLCIECCNSCKEESFRVKDGVFYTATVGVPSSTPLQAALEASGSLFPPARGGEESSPSSSPTGLRPLVPSPLSWFCSEATFCSSVYRRSVDIIMTVGSVGQARLNGGESGEKNNKGCACGGGRAGGSTDFLPDPCFPPNPVYPRTASLSSTRG